MYTDFPFLHQLLKGSLSCKGGFDFIALSVHSLRVQRLKSEISGNADIIWGSIWAWDLCNGIAPMCPGAFRTPNRKNQPYQIIWRYLHSKQKFEGPLKSTQPKQLMVFFGFPLLPRLSLQDPGQVLSTQTPQNRHYLFYDLFSRATHKELLAVTSHGLLSMPLGMLQPKPKKYASTRNSHFLKNWETQRWGSRHFILQMINMQRTASFWQLLVVLMVHSS